MLRTFCSCMCSSRSCAKTTERCFPARAADRDGQLGLPLVPVEGQQVVDEVEQLGDQLLRLLPFEDVLPHRRIEAGQALEFGHVEGVRQAAHVKDEVRLLGQAVFEAEGHAVDEHRLVFVVEEDADHLFPQLVDREVGGVDHIVGALPQPGEQPPFLRDGLLDRGVFVVHQRVGAAGLLIPLDERRVLAVEEEGLKPARRLQKLLDSLEDVPENFPAARVDDERDLSTLSSAWRHRSVKDLTILGGRLSTQ